MLSRERTLLPPTSYIALNEKKKIAFRHPGYPDDFDQNVLLYLHAYDHQSGGLNHFTAWTACAIVARNAWDGYLARKAEGSKELKKIEASHDDILLQNDYYFCLPSSAGTDSYSIYPCFDHWAFPHGNLPPFYTEEVTSGLDPRFTAPPSATNFAHAVTSRDGVCLVTGAADHLQAAHLCPHSQTSWFMNNNMRQYNKNEDLAHESATDDIANGFTLRPDIHMAFDNKSFAVVPKEGRWVAHYFGATHALGSLHHNQCLKIPPDISYAFLLTRLAWTIFPKVAGFLESGPVRHLTVRIEENGQTREETRPFTKSELLSLNLSPDSVRKTLNLLKRKKGSEADPGNTVEDEPLKRQRVLDEGLIGADEVEQITPDDHYSERSPLSPGPKPWDLQSCSADSEHSLPSFNALDLSCTIWKGDSPLAQETIKYNNHIQNLKRKWIHKHRPEDPTLLCCDYNRAEHDMQRGIPADTRKGGAYLCDECLGYEKRDPLIEGAGLVQSAERELDEAESSK